MKYKPEDGKWTANSDVEALKEVRKELGDSEFNEQRKALKVWLCNYFSTGDCAGGLGGSILPMGASTQGGKILKVRWALPGCGKSGGLRLVVVAYCTQKRVHIAQAFWSRDDPAKNDVTAAVEEL